jgi:hypothetical protein
MSVVSHHPRPWLVLIAYWLSALLGTALGGSLFGIIGGPVGMIFGFFIAIVVGAPIHFAAYFLTLVGPLVRIRMVVAILAGAATGAAAAQATFSTWLTMGLAAATGSATTFLVQRWFLKNTWLKDGRDVIAPTNYQFTLRDTLIFLSLSAIVVAFAKHAVRNFDISSAVLNF